MSCFTSPRILGKCGRCGAHAAEVHGPKTLKIICCEKCCVVCLPPAVDVPEVAGNG